MGVATIEGRVQEWRNIVAGLVCKTDDQYVKYLLQIILEAKKRAPQFQNPAAIFGLHVQTLAGEGIPVPNMSIVLLPQAGFGEALCWCAYAPLNEQFARALLEVYTAGNIPVTRSHIPVDGGIRTCDGSYVFHQIMAGRQPTYNLGPMNAILSQ